MTIEILDLNPLIDKYLVPGIKAMIEAEVNRVIERAAHDATEEIRKMAPRIMAEVGLRVSEAVSFDRVGREIRITVHMPKEQS